MELLGDLIYSAGIIQAIILPCLVLQ